MEGSTVKKIWLPFNFQKGKQPQTLAWEEGLFLLQKNWLLSLLCILVLEKYRNHTRKNPSKVISFLLNLLATLKQKYKEKSFFFLEKGNPQCEAWLGSLPGVPASSHLKATTCPLRRCSSHMAHSHLISSDGITSLDCSSQEGNSWESLWSTVGTCIWCQVSSLSAWVKVSRQLHFGNTAIIPFRNDGGGGGVCIFLANLSPKLTLLNWVACSQSPPPQNPEERKNMHRLLRRRNRRENTFKINYKS